MTNKKWMIAALVATLGGAFSSSASAQSAEEVKDDSGEKEDESKHPMDWFGIGLNVGVAGIGSGEYEIDNPVYRPEAAGIVDTGSTCPVDQPKCKVSTASRTGPVLTLKMTFGGEGFGWDLDPYLSFGGGATAMGMYTGWKYDVHAIDPLYIGFGFGPKLAYVKADGYDYAADIYGRGMLRGTYFVLNDLGVIAELGMGYGVSGYLGLPQTDPTTGKDSEPKIGFGSAMTWDLSVGTRWP